MNPLEQSVKSKTRFRRIYKVENHIKDILQLIYPIRFIKVKRIGYSCHGLWVEKTYY